jgi:hypothetical protein
MRRVPLALWLTLLSLGLVLLVVAGLVPAALALFRRLALENARASVQLAALGAREGIERHGEDTLTAARLLAERPTLVRLVEQGAAPARSWSAAGSSPPFRRTCRGRRSRSSERTGSATRSRSAASTGSSPRRRSREASTARRSRCGASRT